MESGWRLRRRRLYLSSVMTPAAETQAFTLERLLREYPWPAEWLRAGEPLHFFWTYDLPVSRESLWPVLSDTSRVNKSLGLAEMQFEERAGKLYGKSKTAGYRLEWEEIPWDWEYLRTLRTARQYSRGFAHYVIARYTLEALGPEHTRLYVYFGWIPRGVVAAVLLKLGMQRLKPRYGPAVLAIVRERFAAQATDAGRDVASTAAAPTLQPAAAAAGARADAARLAAGRKALLAAGLDAALVDRCLRHVDSAEDDELYRIRVRELAQRWQVSERELLVVFLHGVRAGLFYLTWDVICPHCRGVRTEIKHLGELPKRDACDVCEIDFETQGLDSYEITFHIHDSVRPVQKLYFCSAEPAKKPHIKLQLTLAPGERRNVASNLETGVYRLRLQGEKKYRLLNVAPENSGALLAWRSADASDRFEAAPPPDIELVNEAAEPRTFVIDETGIDQSALRPADLFNLQQFRDLFSAEALSSDIELDVGEQTLLFTDIVGSSRFYVQRGDHGAFAAVRRHFVHVFEQVQKYEGAVVKTIGDAVMAAFARPADAVACAIAIQRIFPPDNETEVRLRISIHQGPCLAVRLDSNIDYFGHTVNLTAKLQAAVEAGQTLVTPRVLEDGRVAELLAREKLPRQALKYKQPWNGEYVLAYRYQVS